MGFVATKLLEYVVMWSLAMILETASPSTPPPTPTPDPDPVVRVESAQIIEP